MISITISIRRQTSFASRLLVLGCSVALLAGCGRAERQGPVRTAEEADTAVRQALKTAHLDEQVVTVQRQGGAWVATTRPPDTSMIGHLVSIDAATGEVTFERYRTLQLGGRR